MAANTSPIFGKTPKLSSVLVTAANTSSQGGGTVGTDIFLAYTAGSNGAYVTRVRLIPTATTPTTTTATVARVFVSSVTSGTTASTDTFLIAEQTLAAIAADNATVGVSPYDFVIEAPIPAGYAILVTNHAAPAANTAWRAVVFATDY